MRKDQFIKFWIGRASGVSYCAEAVVLFARMTAIGETPTDARKTAINNCMLSLKAADLFATQFDVFVVTRGHGAGSGLLNWISTSSNGLAVNSPTFTADIGYKHVAATSYINTKYNQRGQGVLFKLNDACFIVKYSYADATASYDGCYTTTGEVGMVLIGGNVMNINSAVDSQTVQATGYNCVTRNNASNYDALVNATKNTYSKASTYLTNLEAFILCYSANGTPTSYRSFSNINELYAFGKYLTQAKFNTLQTIMNTYYATM